MPTNDDFIEYNGENIFAKSLTSPDKKKLFKSKEVNLGTPKRIEPIVEGKLNHKTEVVPILKNEEIVGVMTKCSCGEIVKIYFKYDV
ncbi:hypothetical protein ACFLSX_00360 [Calditrichota bacterium]